MILLSVSIAAWQTNASKASSVGTWKLDRSKVPFGSETPPKSLTLTILTDTPETSSWRVDVVDDKGQSFSYSWSGPTDGSLQPLIGPGGMEIGKESLKRDGDALLRHGEDADGSSFDGRATLSADGNTINDIVTMKSKDGKTSKMTGVMHRMIDGASQRK